MSLQTDIIFVHAIKSNPDITNGLPAKDIYNTSLAMPDEDMDNADLPYIIVSYDGMQNDDSTKDNDYDGIYDRVPISVEIAARTREELANIIIIVRQTIEKFFIQHIDDDSDELYSLIPLSTVVSASRVNYDSDIPCYWQSLNYICETKKD